MAINSSNQDTFVNVSAHAQEREIPFPVLKDFDQKAAEGCGVKRTPEVFLLDAERVIRDHGRIDDQYGIGVRREKPTRHDSAEAVDELTAVAKRVDTQPGPWVIIAKVSENSPTSKPTLDYVLIKRRFMKAMGQ